MLPTFKKTFKNKSGLNLYYQIYMAAGAAPSVLLVHGAGGDADAWQYVAGELAKKGISSIALDLRGHGHSAHPRAFGSYGLVNFAQDIQDVLDQEQIQKIFLVGHSFGATVALYFALLFPQSLKGLVVVSGTYRQPGYITSKTMAYVSAQIMHMLAFVSPPPFRPGHSVYPPGKFHKDYQWLGLVKTVLRNSWRSYLLTNKQLFTLNIETRLKEISVPTLVVVGEKDSIFPLPISQKIHGKIGNSKFHVIAGANHVVILNNVLEVTALLENFFKGT